MLEGRCPARKLVMEVARPEGRCRDTLNKNDVVLVSGSCEGKTFFLDPCGLFEKQDSSSSKPKKEESEEHSLKDKAVRRLQKELREKKKELKKTQKTIRKLLRQIRKSVKEGKRLTRHAMAELRKGSSDKSMHAMRELAETLTDIKKKLKMNETID